MKVDVVPNPAEDPQKDDPYRLKEYALDTLPLDGGIAPQPKTVEPPVYHDNRIYVSNVPFTFNDSDLSKLFSRFGLVVNAMIICNERGSKGFGFVTMDSVESCERARNALNGTRILGRIIEVKKATPLTKAPRQKRPTSNKGPKAATLAPATRPPKMVPAPPNLNFRMPNPAINSAQLAQQAALNQKLVEDSIHALLRGLNPMWPHIDHGLLQQPWQPLIPLMSQLQPLLPSTSPLHQTQPGFPFAVSSMAPAAGNFSLGPNPSLPSLNNLNNSLLNPPPFLQMQDHLVNLLNLDASMMNPKLLDMTASRNPSPMFNSSGFDQIDQQQPIARRKRPSDGDLFSDRRF